MFKPLSSLRKTAPPTVLSTTGPSAGSAVSVVGEVFVPEEATLADVLDGTGEP
jgi:hypothetical protein